MKQKRTQHRLGDFMEGKGFYIVLFLCVAAIGISGYYLFSGLADPMGGFGPEASSAVSGQADLPKEGTERKEPVPKTDQQTPDTKPDKPRTQTKQPAQPPKTEPVRDEAAASSTAYVWPVQGEVARDFSLEVFAYDDTMGDWRTHAGLDVSAEVGAPVCACAKGTVTAVEDDPMMGRTVRVEHSSGMESVYANLAESVNVQVGDTVEAGTVLGTVGTTAIAESASPSHLHFELQEYGVSIDPLNYLH